MKFLKMIPKETGHFIHRYDLVYETNEHREKTYEIISRKKGMTELAELQDSKPDAVVLIMHSGDGKKILLNKEYRMAVAEWTVNFPAGLIDPGEDEKTAAKRELWEETGLTLDSIEDMIPVSFSAVGFSNEKNICVVGTASGEFKPSTSAEEEIEAGWYTKEEVRDLLQTYKFAARTQAYCYLWSKEERSC